MNQQELQISDKTNQINIVDLDYTLQKGQLTNVTIKTCSSHPNSTLNLQECINSINQFGFCTCKICPAQANSINDLVKSIDWIANEQFHSSITSISIIKGLLVNKYVRQKRYKDVFNNNKNLFENLLSRSQIDEQNQQHFQIYSIVKKCQQIQYISLYCGLDRIKMIIPVRIMKCEQQHVECYELTSLCIYWSEAKDEDDKQSKKEEVKQTQEKQKTVKFYCEYCQQTYYWKSLEDLYSNLIIDLQLLNAIKKSIPFSSSLIYDQQNNQLRDQSQQAGGKTLDVQIQAYYEKNQTKINVQFEQFQNSVIQSASICSQGTQNEKIANSIKEKLFQTKYQTFNVNLIDKLTNKIIEYPVRCIKCSDMSQCLDLRSIISDVESGKLLKNTKYNCPLCKSEQKGSLSPNMYLYLDYNILQRIQELYGQNNLQQQQITTFQYDGKQYMLNEFKKKQKYKQQDYIDAYNIKENLNKDNSVIKFSNLICALSDTPLQIPLILKICSNIIDFETFYKWFQDVQYNINADLNICKCSKCLQSKGKILDSIYYHEALGIALEKYGNKKTSVFKFDFKENKIVGFDLTQSQYSKKKVDTVVEMISAPQQGFTDILSDEAYQQFFNEKFLTGTDNKQYKFKIESMQQDFGNVKIQFDQNKVDQNLIGSVQEMNNKISENQNLSKWNFKIENVSYQVNGDLFKIGNEKKQQ